MAINYIADENIENKTIGQSQKQLTLYGAIQMKIYGNKDIERVGFEEEIKNKYFTEQEEKMLCIEDTIYIQTII